MELINGSNESANLEDSVNLIATTVADLLLNNNLTTIEDTPKGCKEQVTNDKWSAGMTILEYVELV